MRITSEAVAPGVAPEEAFRWWSRFEEGHADHPGFSQEGAGRRILRATEREVEMEDTARLLGWRFVERTVATLDPPAAVHLRGRNNLSTFHGTYRFEAHPEGTRVRFEGEVRPRGLLRAVSLLGKPLVWAFVRWDLRLHAREMAKDHRPPQ